MTATVASASQPVGTVDVQQIAGDDDVVRVRQLVRARAVPTRLSLVDQTKLVTAASELARNTLLHGGGGRAEVQIVTNGTQRRIMVSTPGIVGHQHRDIREFDYPSAPGTLVVLHSDGVSERWRVEDYPGLLTHTPVVVAATLLHDAGYRRDDAAVIVARGR